MSFSICLYEAVASDTPDLVEGKGYMMIEINGNEVVLSGNQARETAIALLDRADKIDPVN